MSHADGSTFGWRLWGVVPLIIPTVFVIGALAGDPPTWSLLQHPVVVLGSLAVAVLGNFWSMTHVEVLRGRPPILRIDG